MDSIVASLVGQRGQKSLGCLPAGAKWRVGERKEEERDREDRFWGPSQIPKERKMGRWTRDTLISVGTAAAVTST